jgi:hypothetical protein
MGPLEIADFGKLVSAAQAPVSLIIATSIFLHMLTSRYVPMIERFRRLTEEFRKLQGEGERYDSLRRQIELQAQRIRASHFASRCLSLGVISFVITLVASGASIIYPKVFWVRGIGLLSMGLGLVLLVMATCYELYQDSLSNTVLSIELSEFRDLCKPRAKMSMANASTGSRSPVRAR